jgi:hypothetical protein
VPGHGGGVCGRGVGDSGGAQQAKLCSNAERRHVWQYWPTYGNVGPLLLPLQELMSATLRDGAPGASGGGGAGGRLGQGQGQNSASYSFGLLQSQLQVRADTA